MVPRHILTTYAYQNKKKTIQIFHLFVIRKLKRDKNSGHDATRSTMDGVRAAAGRSIHYTKHNSNRQLVARLAHARTGTA